MYVSRFKFLFLVLIHLNVAEYFFIQAINSFSACWSRKRRKIVSWIGENSLYTAKSSAPCLNVCTFFIPYNTRSCTSIHFHVSTGKYSHLCFDSAGWFVSRLHRLLDQRFTQLKQTRLYLAILNCLSCLLHQNIIS